MKIIKTEFYSVFQAIAKNGGKSLITISGFYKDFTEKYPNFKNENIIVDFSKINDIDLEEILLFSQKSIEHKKGKKSFVILCNGINIDDLNDELIVAPTLIEAEDIIQFEEIERDLEI